MNWKKLFFWRRPPIPKSPGLEIHGLRHGRALCGFSDQPPKAWPQGHVFVSYQAVDSITCEACKVHAWRYQ